MTVQKMSGYEIFIGTWNTSGQVFATENSPAGVLLATDTYRWLPGRHFIVHDADAYFDGYPARSMEVIGYDYGCKKITARSFDDQGVSALFEVTLAGRRWNIIGERVRFEGRFDTKGDKLVGLWELKSEDDNWQPWIKLCLERA